MWILIIMLHWGTGTAMTQIEGFTSPEACQEGGRQCLTKDTSTHNVDFLCIEKR